MVLLYGEVKICIDMCSISLFCSYRDLGLVPKNVKAMFSNTLCRF